jgi:hypothetical protein
MKIRKPILMVLVYFGLLAGNNIATAGLIDLNTFTTFNGFDFNGGQGGGNWVVNMDGTEVTQTINGDSTIFFSPDDFGNSAINGTFRESSADDDFVGFVFGWQSSSEFYLLDWKQGQQDAYGQTALRGVTLKRFFGDPTTQGDFWSTADVPGIMEQLAYHDLARSNGTTYTFALDFASPFIDIKILNGMDELLSFQVNDPSYSTGKFGFYNMSEDNVTYTGFTEEDIPNPCDLDPDLPNCQIPEPGTLAIFGLGIAGLGYARRKKA